MACANAQPLWRIRGAQSDHRSVVCLRNWLCGGVQKEMRLGRKAGTNVVKDLEYHAKGVY